MLHNTKSATSWLYLLIDGMITPEIFTKCDIPSHPEDDAKLANIIKSVHQLGLSVNAENIWEVSKDTYVLSRYMEIANDIGWDEVAKSVRK